MRSWRARDLEQPDRLSKVPLAISSPVPSRTRVVPVQPLASMHDVFKRALGKFYGNDIEDRGINS